MQWITVKCGDGGDTNSWAQFSPTLIAQAHAAGLKIFGWAYVYGNKFNNVQGEINTALTCLDKGADGFIIDAEVEYEAAGQPAAAAQYCQGIRARYPNTFLAHAPFPYISLHSAFPYNVFGYYCDAVMPQDYWDAIGVTPTKMITDMDNQWTTWQNGLTGTNRLAIKPIVPLAETYSPSSTQIETGAEITTFVNGISFWDSQERNTNMDTAVIAATIGGTNPPAITTQPHDLFANQGNTPKFTVVATGTAPLYYYWQFNGTNVAFGTNASYSISNVQLTNQGTYSVVVSNTADTVTSSNAFLTVGVLPAITGQPQNLSVPQGSNATFNVIATGNPAPAYYWLRNGANIDSATNASYTVSNTQLSDQANYSVIVSNATGTTISSNANLVVQAAPIITTVLTANQTVNPGAHAIFSVTATGTAPLHYQWLTGQTTFANATNITGANGASYTILSAQPAQSGNYWAVVTNAYGSAISPVQILTVTPPTPTTPKFAGINFTSTGQIQLQLSGKIGSSYAIDISSNLIDWVQLTTLTNTTGTAQFTDTSATNHPQGYYRARLLSP
jgi:Immunoglobulin domain/Immunoglobulin I-set domain